MKLGFSGYQMQLDRLQVKVCVQERSRDDSARLEKVVKEGILIEMLTSYKVATAST
jgi:hypothetical protein